MRADLRAIEFLVKIGCLKVCQSPRLSAQEALDSCFMRLGVMSRLCAAKRRCRHHGGQ